MFEVGCEDVNPKGRMRGALILPALLCSVNIDEMVMDG